jgi:uncharacterized protein (TIGR03437 family)
MRKRSLFFLLTCLCLAAPSRPAQDSVTCGTYRDKGTEQLQVHRRAVRLRAAAGERALTVAPRSYDAGDIAVLEDAGDLIAPYNGFDLDQHTITFTPAAGGYRFVTGPGSYDQTAAASGTFLANLGDDDSRETSLPFPFPFYGNSYRAVFVNSDGNLTFGQPDTGTGDRSLGRMTSGPPRIAPLFRDLNPTQSLQGVFVLAEASRLVVTWAAVPDFDGTYPQTFQMRLYADGRVEFAYNGVATDAALVGISPGGDQGTTTLVSFTGEPSAEYAGTIAERFTTAAEVDVVATAKRFYQTHEDAYDYLVIYNYAGVLAAPGAVAYEMTARNVNRAGYGDTPSDIGGEFGSLHRLQSVMNMGPLTQYPSNLDANVGSRGRITGDSAMTILGHEAGHLFLAFASVRDPQDPADRPMLKPDGVHWSFNFNSEASLLEGNRIRDDGNGNFFTTATVEGYSLLDQYLMGFVPSEQVPPTFFVANSSSPATRFSQANQPLTGTRRDVHIEEIVQAEGRRAPDPDVSQRRFRFAFILVTDPQRQPSDADMQTLETFRSRFPEYYSRYSGGLAIAETTLRRNLRLSVAPAAGVLAGTTVPATVSIDAPAAAPLVVRFDTPSGGTYAVPLSVTIGAGATSAPFQITGVAPGVDDLVGRADDPQFMTAWSRIRVTGAQSVLRLSAVPDSAPDVALRVTDIGDLPYAGVSVRAAASGGGVVTPQEAVSDSNGLVSLDWNAGAGGGAVLEATAQGATSATYDGVVNAASYSFGLAPGAFAAVFGHGLAGGADAGISPYPEELSGVQVTVDGEPAVLHYASDRQINLVVPAGTSAGARNLAISTPGGSFILAQAQVLAAAPGIFFDPFSGWGAAVRFGNTLEIYGTGMGAALPVTVYLGGVQLTPTSFGPSSSTPGLDLVDVPIPTGLSGEQSLVIEVNGRRSNTVRVVL